MAAISFSAQIHLSFEELASYVRVLDGPADQAELFADLDDYVDIDAHADCNYCIGHIAGAAAAREQLPLGLFEALGCGPNAAALDERCSASR